MPESVYKQLSFAIYCAMVGLAALLSSMLQSNFQFDENIWSAHRSSSRFQDATINAYGNTTNLLYRLSSPEIYYHQNYGFEFEQPKFVYQTVQTTPLNLSARKGYMENDSTLIELLGDVDLYHLNPQNDIPEYLYTSDATIDLNRKKAYTSNKAIFKQYKKTTEGVGMIVDLEKQTIKLQSNIKVLNTP